MAYKLLLADDSVTIQRVIELTFADEDVVVASVGDGEQAIQRIDADPPDIVLVDVGMPKRDGYDVAAYIKSQPRLAHIPVVLLTGAFEPVDQARAKAAGCDGVLAKPFEPQMVINRVKQLLGARAEPPRKRPIPPATARMTASAMPRPLPAAPDGPPQVLSATPVPDPTLPVTGPADSEASLDEYFDQLDAAFAALEDADSAAATTGAEASPAPSAGPADGIDWSMDDTSVKNGGAGDADLDFGTATDGSASSTTDGGEMDFFDVAGIEEEAPASPPASAEDSIVVAAPPGPAASDSTPAPSPVPPPPSLPPHIADAFAELFAAEQDAAGLDPVEPSAEDVVGAGPTPDSAIVTTSRWTPAPVAAAGPASEAGGAGASAVSEELIEEICRRVLARLTDGIVRATLVECVPQIAERVVHEELQRLRERQ